VTVRAGFRAAFSDPLIRRFILSYAFVGACAITAEALAPAFVEAELDGGAGMVGVLSAIVSAGAVVSTFFLPRKGGDEHLIRAGAWLAAGGALVSGFAFAFGSGLAGATIAYAALGVVFASRVLGNQVVGKRLPDRVRAAAFSVLLGVIALGQATGPLLAGLVAEHIGVRSALAGAAVAAALVSAVAAVAPQRSGAVTQPA
jgi:MFS family permease